MDLKIILLFIFGLINISIQDERRIIQKNIGNIQFFDKIWTLNYDINLSTYFQNAEILLNGTNELKRVCIELEKHDSCNHIIDNFKNELTQVQNNVNQMKSNLVGRKKRFSSIISTLFRTIGSKTFAVTMVANVATSTFISGQIADAQEEALRLKQEIIGKQFNITKNHIVNQYKMLNESMTLHEQELLSNIKQKEFDNIFQILYLTLVRHYKDTAIYTGLCSNEIKSVFFNAIDIEQFTKEIQKINNELIVQNLTLPTTNTNEIFELSKLSHMKNSTHIKILIEIPIVEKTDFKLKEIIPIPFLYENEVYILKTQSKYYFSNQDHKNIIMTENNFKSCKHQSNLTICNSVLKQKLSDNDKCINSLILNETNFLCEYLKISKQNYIIETSKFSTYCYVNEPFKLRITCNNENFIYNLTSNKEIFYEENCNIFKISNQSNNNISTFTSIEITYDYIKPNFTIFNVTSRNWTKINMINRHKIELLNLINATDQSNTTLKEQGTKNTTYRIYKFTGYCYEIISTGLIWFYNFFINLTNFLYLVITIIVFMIIYRMCNYRGNN